MKTSERESLLTAIGPEFEITRGHPLPFGATVMRGGINFSVFSSTATMVHLVLFESGRPEPVVEFPLDPRYHRTGDVWHLFTKTLNSNIEYGYRMDRSDNEAPQLHRFDQQVVLLDPYAKSLTTGFCSTGEVEKNASSTHLITVPRRCKVTDNEFDWGFEQPLNYHLADSIIYEVHVKGFTRQATVAHPGTFRGLIERIPYLQELGITAVELMPVTDFDEDLPRVNPLTGERLKNYWGYHPVSFFALKDSYASNGEPIREFKEMVKALHDAGIEVILDMVFNHTAEGDQNGPTLSFRGLDNQTYYLIDPITGDYHNYSGCGNTLNCNHPVARDLILDSLRYWVTEMHVDGFRFDLASILGRGRDGSVLANPPLLERIAADPVLANVKLIAEAWDAAGLYQVGSFPHWGRWAEWNGKFRDDVRRFVKGDDGMVSALATRLTGSADLYQGSGRAPFHSINFVTSHDGFSLADLVAYNHKHNEANGEHGRDGDNDNHSWNCGAEGPSSSAEVNRLRLIQMKNLAALLLLSQGVPMMLGGDEIGRSQGGNNNTYCHDNELNWFDWNLLEVNAELFRFFKLLIQFRKRHAALRPRAFGKDSEPNAPKISWHGLQPFQPDWSAGSHSIAMMISGDPNNDDLLIIANAHWESLQFWLPTCQEGRRWHRFADTSRESPSDICEIGEESDLGSEHLQTVAARSLIVLVAKDA
ncbi:MAG TPA: glycogen debranching protein GlgX [Pyrinomonadaceae bacterium]|nr:glycogen debranching protein GlgX [Pyrinomonadaceae bacterium]